MIPLGLYGASQPRGSFSPSDLDLLAWWDASDASTITSSGGVVSEWRDKSGNGIHVAAASSGPTTGATLNGLDVLTFSGSNTPLSRSATDVAMWKALHDGTKVLYGAVFAKDATGNHGLLSTREDGAGNPAGAWLYLNGTSYWVLVSKSGSPSSLASSQNASHLTTGVPLVSTVLTAVAETVAADRIAVHKNDGGSGTENAFATAHDPSVAASRPLFIGGLSASGQRLNGRIGELVIVTGADATETNRVKLRDYLNAKWGIY